MKNNHRKSLKELANLLNQFERLESNLQRWYDLLGKSNINSKGIVRNEIEAVLEDLKKNG